MHNEAFAWIAEHATDYRVHVDGTVRVLDLGGRDINGSARKAFPDTDYTVLDILPGEGVDIVADASTWQPDRAYDYVVAAEIFEHTAAWPAICRTAYKALHFDGKFIVTTAGPGRSPHSAIDGMLPLRPGEHYANIPGFELERVLKEAGFVDVVVDCQPDPADTRAVATR